MAKAKQQSAEAQKDPQESAPAESVALAVRAVMDITGCGEPAARDRVSTMDTTLVLRIAKLEQADKRVDIVALLY